MGPQRRIGTSAALLHRNLGIHLWKNTLTEVTVACTEDGVDDSTERDDIELKLLEGSVVRRSCCRYDL